MNSWNFLTSSLVVATVKVPHPVPSKDAFFSPPNFWSVQLHAVCLFAGCLSFQDPRAATIELGSQERSRNDVPWCTSTTNIENMSLIYVQHPRSRKPMPHMPLDIQIVQGMRHHCLFGAQSMAARRFSKLTRRQDLAASKPRFLL